VEFTDSITPLKNKFLLFYLIFCFGQLLWVGKVWGQTYTTTGNNTNWNNAAAWTINTSPCAPISTSNGGPPPPRILNSGNACPVKIIINHPITFTGNTGFGGGFMDSLIVNTGGNLTITGDLDINNVGNSVGPFSITVRGGGVMNVNGNFTNQNNASVRVQTAGILSVGNNYSTAGSGSELIVDGTSTLNVFNTVTINSNHVLSVAGNLNTSNLSTGSGGAITFSGNSAISISNSLSHTNGSISLINQANISVGNGLTMSGSAVLNLSGNTDISVAGTFDLINGTINNGENGDIRVGGDLNMSGGGTYTGSGNSYIGISGNHNITSTNPVNLSGDSKFFVDGNRNGGMGGTIASTSCYRASNANSGNTTCLPCSSSLIANGTFYVPAGVTQITVEMIGGGGRGGNRTTAGGSGGGGGGAYSRITIPVTPGEPLGVFVGEGGNSTTANGGTTYVTRDPALSPTTASILFAGGGIAGANNVITGGNAGVADARSGRVSFAGGRGSDSNGSGSGGGGSAAASTQIGNVGNVTNGGADPIGIGGPGGNGNNNNNSNGSAPALGFGGGGGGGRSNNSTPRNGGNGNSGYVIISFSCPTNSPCSKFLDFGTNDGLTIIEYLCNGVWNAPEGLESFSVSSIGGGGGGGFGSSAGGGGGGAILTQTFSNLNQQPASSPSMPTITYGLPANTNFTVTVGVSSPGATAAGNRGQNGLPSGINGTFLNYANSSVTLSSSALGGGGGGSSSTTAANRNGLQGGSGGGGATVSGQEVGSAGSIGVSGLRNSGSVARNGSNSTLQGGGGGGAGSDGNIGSNSGNGQSNGGNGGSGGLTLVPGISTLFSGGGGGTATGANNNFNGSGGSGGGGNGNLSGFGGSGTVNTGSGGGAGSTGGGAGGSGRVYIYYQNFRILPVEFLYFNASFNSTIRTGELSWATAKEWENSHFEIERSINNIKSWTVIDQVAGAGYSDSPVAYSFQDGNLPAAGGIVYYRLKQVDFSGTYAYSDTKSIKVAAIKGKGAWIAYPNPSSEKNTVTVDLLNRSVYYDEPILIQISDIRGVSEVFTVNQIESISEVVNAYLDRSVSGVYILQLIWGNRSQQIKLLRE
jgi:hypothetical protein